MSCSDLDAKDALLAATVAGGEPADAVVKHLASCAECQLDVQRARSLQEHWQQEALPAPEVLRLRLKLMGPKSGVRPRHRTAWVLGGALAGALLAGSAVASVAAGWWTPEPPATPKAAPASEAPAPAPRPQLRVGKPQPPEVLEPEPPSVEVEPPPVSKGTKPASAAKPRTADAPKWAEAAEALKHNDVDKAERALHGLGQSDDPITRDTAQLTLAEMYVKQGSSERAKPILQRLMKSGSTPTVRARAQDLLSR